MPYEIEEYKEEKYLEKYPVWNDIIKAITKKYGVDISKYYFSHCLGYWDHHLEVSFVCIDDEDVSLTIQIINRDSTCDFEKIHLEND